MENFIPETRYVEVEFDPFAGPAIQRTAPTTEAQREVWLASQVGREAACAYIESVTLCLDGALEPGHIQSAIRYVARRHEGLRSTISADGLRLIVMEQMEIPQACTDLGGLSPQEQQERLQAIGDEDMEQPFDLLNGPLFRTHLIRLGEREHQLRLTGHHVVLDGWSMGIVMGDISHAYTAHAAGRQPELPPAHRFSDFALAQIDFMASKEFAEVERYWLDLFKGAAPRLDLPTDRPRPQRKTFASRRLDMEMDPALAQRLREMATRAGTSLVTSLLTCFEILLYRLTGDGDLCIGLPAAGQNDFGMKELVGHCVNLLALRSTIDGERPFIDHLKERRRAMLDASDNQKYTFGTLVRKLNVPREPGRIPLCPVVFNLDMDIDSEVSFHGLQHRVISNPRKYENFEIFLNVTGKGNALVLEWNYNTDLFDAATIGRMADQLHALIGGIVDDPARPIDELPLLQAADMQALAALQPPPTPAPPGADPLMHAAFIRQAAAAPERSALCFGNESLSYRQLDERSNQLAHALRARGIGRGQRVGICLERGPDMLAALLAVLKSGAAYVPLDPGFPQARLDYYAADAQLALLLTGTQVHTAPRAWRPDAGQRILLLDQDNGQLARPAAAPAPDAQLDARPGDAAYIIYTSGSTGKPKGVVVPHRAVANFLRSMQRQPGISGDDRLLAVTTLSFDIAVLELMLPLCTGATVVMADRDTAMDGTRLAALLRESAATLMQATPATWRMLIDAGWEGRKGFKALCGGEAMPAQLASALLGRCDELWNLYGPTETTVWSTCARILPTDSAPDIHIGRPIDNTSVWILDARRQPCPMGVPGEIGIGGEGLAPGYLDRPELTAERFVTVAINGKNERLYLTGDRGRWRNDGTLEHLGRMDFQVKVRGYRIELGEIEARCNEAPGVARCVAITREDRPGDVRLAAYLVLDDPQRFDPTALRGHLTATLPQYMVPQHIVVLDALPLLPNGKIDRKALPKPESGPADAADRQAPRNDIERALAEIWERLLGITAVGIHDNFFDLGGHSLTGIQMLAQVRAAFNVEISLLAVFEAPTVAALADVIAGAARPARAPITPVGKDGDLEVSFGQQRMWLSSQLGDDAYDMSQAVRITGDLNVDTLARALDALVARHEPLRTTFDATAAGLLVQHVHAPAARDLPLEDVASLQEAIDRCQRESLRPYDLGAGPLFEPRLYRINAHDHVLLLRMHHIVGDEWSIGVLLRDLGQLYRGHDLPPLKFSYADFAAWQRTHFTDDVIARGLGYWRDQLAGAPALLELPTDRPRPSMYGTKGALRRHLLPSKLWHRIEAVGQQHQATPFMTLLAAFQVLLHRYAGVTDIPVGTPISNRDQPGSEDLVGFFINTLVLRTDLSGAPGFIDLLARVRRAALGAFEHQDIPFERVVEALVPRRNPAHAPLFQVSFVHQPMGGLPTVPGLTFEQVDLATSTAKFDLTLFTAPGPDGLACTLEYNTDLFDAATIDRLLDHFHALLEGIVDDPARSIDALPLPAAGEPGRLPAEWNGKHSPFPRDSSMGQLFREVADAYPERIALEMGGTQVSYGALKQRMLVIAGRLERAGTGPGDLVGLCSDRCPDMVAAMLAILWRGAAFVPFDPGYPKERLAHMFTDSGVKVLLAQEHLAGMLPANPAKVLLLDTAGDEAPTVNGPQGTALSPAYIMYTSGSTGQPKGVVVPHRAIVRLVKGQDFLPFGPDLVFLQLSNISFDASTLELWGALLNGAKLVLQPQQKPTLQEIVGTIRQHKVTTAWFTAGLFNLLVDEHVEELRGLRHILAGGDVLSVPHVKRALRVLGPGVLINGYGPTENTTFTCCHPINDEHAIQDRVPIGRPLNNTTVYILDEAMRPVAAGEQGELYAGGDGVALGYLHKPDLTAAHFVDDPFSDVPGAKLYRTGDRAAWLPDGSIDFLGRADGQVKVRGFRIEPGEIEHAISRLADVKDNVVVVRSDMPGEKQLAAYVVPRTLHGANGDASAQEHLIGTLREHLRNTMPAYMVPTAFVILDALPLNANGKVDKHALPVPEHRAQTMAATHTAPRNANEARLAKLWGELLNTPDPGVHDNFFDLGGQSMTGIRLLARVEDEFGTRLPLNALFQAPTIAGFAELLQKKMGTTGLKNLAALQPEGSRQPFFCVHGDEANNHLVRYLGKDQPFYAFFHQGEDGAPFEHNTVEEIARHYVDEMLSVQPEGPYLLCGYSFGGMVAYEMAVQLSAMGHEVPLLLLIDSHAPEEYLQAMREERKFHQPIKDAIMRWIVKRELAKGKIRSPRLRHFHIIDNYIKASIAYKPKPYNGPVTVFRAGHSSGADDMGWGRFVKGHIDTRTLPGNHYSLIKGKDVKLLVQELSACIDRALSKHAVEAV